MENAKVIPEHLIDEHIGFQIGPRLNAVGRLADANISIPLLTTSDEKQADEIANELEQLNNERKLQTEFVFASALEQIRKDPALLQFEVLVLGHSTWHQGVIGIVASRMVELYGKPSILISMPDGELARGSARSTEGVHITQAIATQEAILTGFGGHPMAAGLAINPDHLATFRKGVSKAVIDQSTGQKPEPTLKIDAEITLKDITQNLSRELELMAPFGPGNPPINLLCRKLLVIGEVKIGRDKAHKKLVVRDEENNEQRELLWWNSKDKNYPDEYLDCVIRIRPGYFRGEEQLTITVQDVRPSGVRLEAPTAEKRISIIDYRETVDARKLVEGLIEEDPSIQVWAEPTANLPFASNRLALKTSTTLVIWSLPSSQHTLMEVLAKVRPLEIYVIGAESGLDKADSFFKRFVGLIKFVLSNYGGEVDLSKLAAEMGHTPGVIRVALNMLSSMGVYAVVNEKGAVVLEQRPPLTNIDAEKELSYLLHETNAYRSLFARTSDLSRFLIMPEWENEDQASSTIKSVSRTHTSNTS